MKNYKPSLLATAVIAAACVPVATHADSNISFSFSPPPITSVAAPGERINKGSVGYTMLEFGDSELDLLNLNLLTKRDGMFGSLGFVTGEDDSGNLYMTGLAGMLGVERMLDSGVAMAVGVGLNYLYTEYDDRVADVYAETYITTVPAMASIQKRFPINDAVGVTPYLILNAVLLGSASTDTNTAAGFSSYEYDFDPYLGIQLGADIDFGGYSLGAFYQSADDSSVTSLTFSFEF